MMLEKYDVIVVGAGHAGCEAANSRTNRAINFFIVTPNNREWKLYYLAE